MAEPRSVVITGASRGLGFATAVRLYREGWRVVAAMRTPEQGMALLREAAGAACRRRSVDRRAARSVGRTRRSPRPPRPSKKPSAHRLRWCTTRGSPPPEWWKRPIWRCGRGCLPPAFLGPVALTQALLPSMRAAGEGRIVLVSSAAGVRGQPATAPYSAAKGALERWGESMAVEIAPFGLGVTVLVAGTYDTEIITDAGTTDDRDFGGPYARLHNTMNTRGRFAMRMARPPEQVHRWSGQGTGRHRVVPPTRVWDRMRRCCWYPAGFFRPSACITCRGSCSAYPNRARCATARGR